ncbi:MAG: hypothetical protein ACI6PR_07915 [Pseudoalteromonas sp.]|uniref:hypothetical protein n=1 Tax=Pseudoalteromonas sp. TaxID=53249 RepID=UPI00384D38AB
MLKIKNLISASVILLFSHSSLANICKSLLDNGIRDNFSILTKSSKFSIYQKALCDEKYDSYNTYSSAVNKQDLNLTTADGILGLTGTSDNKRSKFKDSYSKFCTASFDSSDVKRTFDSFRSVINTDLASAFNQCVSTISNYKANNNLDVYIDVTPQPDNSSFTVRVHRPTTAQTKITDISPVSVQCQTGGEIMELPFEVSKRKFTLDCKKENDTSVIFQITTENEGFSNTVTVPDQRDRLQNIEEQIADLEYELKILSPQTVIIAVASDSCPDGWTDYENAYGRFLRGIDKSNKKIDPDGRRNHGTLQEDLVKKHQHPYKSAASKDVSGKGSKSNFAWNSADYSTDVNKSGGVETRPKNVALLFCQRK